MLHVIHQTTDGIVPVSSCPNKRGACAWKSEKEEVMAVLHFHQLPGKFFLSLQFQLAFFGGLGARKFLFGTCLAST